jgi:virginiamycin B lyase
VHEFALAANTRPVGITLGPDNNLWFVESQANKVGRITPTGTVTEFAIPTAASNPQGITAGPDGNLWFTEKDANKIGQVSTSGAFAEFAVPPAHRGSRQPRTAISGLPN